MRFLKGRLTPSMIVAVAAVVFAAAGSATAAALITSKDIKDRSIQNRDIKPRSITLNRLSPGLQQLVRAGSSVSGQSVGAQGAPGANGAPGTPGANGANGSDGADGADGQNGADGADGQDGAPGPQGPQGPAGANADGSVTTRVTNDNATALGFTVAAVPGTGGVTNATPTLANGVLRLQINDTGGGVARLSRPYASVPLSSLNALAYKFAVDARNGNDVAPVIRFFIEDATPSEVGDVGHGDRPLFANNGTAFVFEPTYTDPNTAGGTIDALTGNWYSTRDAKGAADHDGANADGYVNQTIARLVQNNPNAKIVGLSVEAGQNSTGGPWNSFDGSVDWLNIGFDGEDVTRFDFG